MKKSFDDYTWLAGGRGLRGSLWSGPDHLLVIQGSGFILPYREFYRRIDYKNIQALTLAQTRSFGWITALLALTAVVSGTALGLLLANRGFDGFAVAAAVPLTVSILLLIIHLAKGATCVCTLQTAVLSLRLKPLKRLATAESALARLHELCRAHQGEMPAEFPGAPLVGEQNAWFTPAGAKPAFSGSKAACWGLGLLALWGAMLAGEMFVNNVAYFCAHVMLAVAAFVLIIAGLARVSRHRRVGALLAILWSSLGTLVIAGITAYIAFMIVLLPMSMGKTRSKSSENVKVTVSTGTGLTPEKIITELAAYDLKQAGTLGWIIIGIGTAGVVLGVAGFPLAMRRAQGAAPAAPSAPAL